MSVGVRKDDFRIFRSRLPNLTFAVFGQVQNPQRIISSLWFLLLTTDLAGFVIISLFLLYYPNQFWVAPRIGPHSGSANLLTG